MGLHSDAFFLQLPDIVETVPVGGIGDIELKILNLTCSHVFIQDLNFSTISPKENTKSQTIRLEITNLEITCNADYFEARKIVSAYVSSGVELKAVIDQLHTNIVFESSDFTKLPPSKVFVEPNSCGLASQPEITITLEKASKFLQAIATGIKGVLPSIINLRSIICDEIVKIIVSQPLTDVLRDFEKLILETTEIGRTYIDPMRIEKVPWKREDLHLSDLVNFTNNTYFELGFSAINGGFSTTLADNEGFEGVHLNNSVSKFVRGITDENGTLNISDSSVLLYREVGKAMNLTVLLHGFQIRGLDSIVEFIPMKVLAPFTLDTNATFKNVVLNAQIEIILLATNNNNATLLQDRFNLTLDLGYADINLALMLGIGIKEFEALKFGSALKSPVDCLLTTFRYFNVSKALIDVHRLEAPPYVEGFLDSAANEILQQLLFVFYRLYGGSILPTVTGIFARDGPKLANSLLENFVETYDLCPEPVPYEKDVYFDFAHDEYFQDLAGAIRSDIVPKINSEYIDPFTEAQSGIKGTYILQTEKEIGKIYIDGVGGLYLSAENIIVSGLDSIHNVSFMETPQCADFPYMLRNGLDLGGEVLVHKNATWKSEQTTMISMGNDMYSVNRPVVLSILFNVNFNGPAANFSNMFDFTFTFDNFLVALDFVAMINRNKFEMMTLGNLTSFNCIFSRMDNARIASFIAKFGEVKVGISCRNCTSPGMAEMEEKVKDPKNNQQFTTTLNKWFATVIARVEEAVSPEHLREAIEVANQKCFGTYEPPMADYHHYESHFVSHINVFGIIGGMVLVMFLSIIVSCIMSRRRKPIQFLKATDVPLRMESDADADDERMIDDTDASTSEGNRFYRFDSHTSDNADILVDPEDFDETLESDSEETFTIRHHRAPLFLHPATPKWARYGIVGILLTNIGLFVFGHLITAANINVKFMLLGDPIRLDNFQEFSITKSIKDMWNAKVYPLCFLIATLSGAWPYAKVLTMLYCWVVPTFMLSVPKRGKRLMILDMLGKWSMIDVYVLLVFMVAFGLKIENPRLDILPDHFYSVYVFVDPAIGLISFTAAAMLSLLANNVCLYYHRNAVAFDEQVNQDRFLRSQTNREREMDVSTSHMTSPLNPDAIDEASQIELTRMGEDQTSFLQQQDETRNLNAWLDYDGINDDGAAIKVFDHEKREALWQHEFTLPSLEKATVRFTKRGKYVVVMLLAVCFGLVLYGCIAASFGMQVYGLVGMFMDVDTITSWMPYSVFEVFIFALHQALTSEVGGIVYLLGVVYLSLSFIVTALVMPLVQILLLAYLWLKPMSLKKMKWYYFLAEVSSAWAAIDVFIVALIIGCLELGELSGFLLEAVCHKLLPTINGVLVPNGFIQEENATCLYIAAGLEIGAVLLVTGALLTGIVNQIILRSCHHAINERLDANAHFMPGKRKAPGCFLRGLVRFANNVGIVTVDFQTPIDENFDRM